MSKTADQLSQINSPLAKFNSVGQLMCILCNAPVKSVKVWTAHVNGRKHREAAAALKAQKAGVGAISATTKRKSSTETEPSTTNQQHQKKYRLEPSVNANGLPSDFFDGGGTKATTSESNQNQDAPVKATKMANQDIPDFRDLSEQNSLQEESSKDEPKPTTSSKDEALNVPEGFFDDAKLDRRKRGVDERDPIEIEFEKFQKEMKQVDIQNEALADQIDESEEIERTVEQIDVQIAQWQRVNELQEFKEHLDQNVKNSQLDRDANLSDENEPADDVDVEQVLNWRAKNL